MKKIVIGVPSNRDVNIHTWRSIRGLQKPSEFEILELPEPGAILWGVRGSIVHQSLRDPEVHYLFFCDSDMVLPPHALVRMLERDKDIVCGLCCRRSPLFEPVIAAGWDEAKGPIWDKGFFPLAGLHPVWGSGLACSLIKRHVLERVIEKHGPHIFWHDRLPDGSPPGEDIAFFRKTNELGFRTWLDADVHVGHLADWPIFPIDAMRLHSANLELNRTIMEQNREIAALKSPFGTMELVQV